MKFWSVLVLLVAMVAAFAGVLAAPSPNPDPRINPKQVIRGAQIGATIYEGIKAVKDKIRGG